MHASRARYRTVTECARRASNERYHDPRAGLWRSAFGAHRAAHCLDHGPRDVQAHTNAALIVYAAVNVLTLRERLEDPREVRRQANAFIFDRQLDATPTTTGTHRHHAPRRRVLHGVVDELVERLGQRLGVADDREVGRHVDDEVVQGSEGAETIDDVDDDFVHRQWRLGDA